MPTDTALYDLMSWMSPAWPIGAFAHSSGLEWAVEAGHVKDRATTADWIETLFAHGPLYNDTALFVYAWRAAQAGDAGRLLEVADLSAASQAGFERRLEATAQGAAFRRIALASIDPPRNGEVAVRRTDGGAGSYRASALLAGQLPAPPPPLRGGPPPRSGEDRTFADLLAAIDDEDLTYPIVAAVLFAAQGIDLRQGLTAWLHGAAANLVSAAQRLVPLGQTDGQKVLRAMRAPILAAVEAALVLPDDDPFEALGGCTLLAEIGCMAHETQYTRLFRT